MSTTSKTICDLCGITQPADYKEQMGWAYVRVTGGLSSRDFCTQCWRPVEKVLLRNFVDGLLLEAQGIKEEVE